MSAPCPACGFDGDTVSPADAIAALRSYPRRYRALLIPPGDEDGDGIVREGKDPALRPGAAGGGGAAPTGWPAMSIDATPGARPVVLTRGDPDVWAPSIAPPSAPT